MNNILLGLNLNKQKRILDNILILNILNSKNVERKSNVYAFVFFVNFSFMMKFFAGTAFGVKNFEKLFVFNRFDLSGISFYIYCPFIYCFVYF